MFRTSLSYATSGMASALTFCLLLVALAHPGYSTRRTVSRTYWSLRQKEPACRDATTRRCVFAADFRLHRIQKEKTRARDSSRDFEPCVRVPTLFIIIILLLFTRSVSAALFCRAAHIAPLITLLTAIYLFGGVGQQEGVLSSRVPLSSVSFVTSRFRPVL